MEKFHDKFAEVMCLRNPHSFDGVKTCLRIVLEDGMIFDAVARDLYRQHMKDGGADEDEIDSLLATI